MTISEGFKKDGFAQKAGGIFLFPAPYPAQIPFPAVYADMVGQDTRSYPLMSVPERIETTTHIEIPAGMTAQLPQDKEISNDIASFGVHYSFDNAKITATRILQVNTNPISPGKYPLYKKVVDAMLEDANTMIIIKPGT